MADRRVTYLVSPEELEGKEAMIVGDGYRHLFRSRRLATGASIRLVDGAGIARWSRVVEIEPDRARVVLEGEAASNEPTLLVRLVVPAMRPERTAILIEKATEIGVAAIAFLRFERSPRRPSVNRMKRWQRVARAAVEQCHRAVVPTLDPLIEWSAFEKTLDAGSLRVVLDPRASDRIPLLASQQSAVVVVGPEGGLTSGEFAKLERFGFVPATLGNRVLRTETAALTAAAKLLL